MAKKLIAIGIADLAPFLIKLGVPVPNPNALDYLLGGVITPAPSGGAGTDTRTVINGPKALPTGVSWKTGGMELRSEMTNTNGRIVVPPGYYMSTDPSVPVFTLNAGATPIDFLDGVVIAHAGRGISGGGGTNVTMRDVSTYGLKPNVDNQPRERAIQISNGTNVDIKYVSMQSAGASTLSCGAVTTRRPSR